MLKLSHYQRRSSFVPGPEVTNFCFSGSVNLYLGSKASRTACKYI